MTTLKHAHRGVFIGAGFYFAAVIVYCVYNYAATRAELLKELDHRLMVGARALCANIAETLRPLKLV